MRSGILFSDLGSTAIALAATDPREPIARCCQGLENATGLKGKVYLPKSTEYEGRLRTYWSTGAALAPWCMVQPLTAQDVSITIKTLVANDCPFGIRGGGHGSFPLSNSVKDGVTIDFGNMNATTWNPDTKLASIRPGGHWQSVYDALAPHGVVVTGGRAGTVGTGGFLAGGGNSFHSASHGMACDTVANFEIVLADGSIINANATNHPDLWQALKGGSGNFGLITRFDMYPIEFPDPKNPVIWGDENSSSLVYWAYLPQVIGGTMINAAIENTLAKVDILSSVTNELGSGQPAGFRNIWFTAAFRNDARPMNYAVEKFFKLNASLEKIAPSSKTGLNTLCMFQPITKSIVDKGIANGGNVMGLDKYIKNGNGMMFLVTVALNGEEEEKLATPMVAAYLNDVDAYAASLGLKWEWKYLNYAHKSQVVIPTFGEEAVKKLRAASAKYDPEGVFQRLRSSGFKISGENETDEL
ncbi:FAD-dependent monooxygenase sdcF [Cladobotryum mycophilum]|uniref:FAD-dependent monooxygenase sdcF n=1 Tax=Cladobotryum mycophilum TaxID=491253 RepID=A0ABR0SWW6_9HYPO